MILRCLWVDAQVMEEQRMVTKLFSTGRQPIAINQIDRFANMIRRPHVPHRDATTSRNDALVHAKPLFYLCSRKRWVIGIPLLVATVIGTLIGRCQDKGTRIRGRTYFQNLRFSFFCPLFFTQWQQASHYPQTRYLSTNLATSSACVKPKL